MPRRKERETSLYGDEESGTPPNELYIEEDAKTALKEAASILEACEGLVGKKTQSPLSHVDHGQ